jgi:uncharacterized membrane protein
MTTLFQLLLIFGVPALVLFLEPRVKLVSWIGPVVLCYLVGIIGGTLPFWAPDIQLAGLLTGLSAVLAIPLVLFSTDLNRWKRLAGKTMLSFAFCLLAILISASVAYWWMGSELADSGKLAGMTVGVYSGGTVNLNIIASILRAEPEMIAQANISDLLVSVVYLLMLFTVMQRIALLFLPAFRSAGGDTWVDTAQADRPLKDRLVSGLKGFGLAMVCVGLSFGVGELSGLEAEVKDTLVLVGVTLLGLGLSTRPEIRNLPGTFGLGEYFLLVFCVAIGLQINLQDLLDLNQFGNMVIFMAIAIYGAILIHFLLAYLFKIDADTAIITSVAAVFSPAFVPPIARVLKNKEVIPSGMTTGVIGFVLGSFLGLGLAYVLG